jgi:hypothetical protein
VVTREAVRVVDPAAIEIDCRKMTSLPSANYAFVAWTIVPSGECRAA